MFARPPPGAVYSARDRIEHAAHVDRIEAGAETLGLGSEARSNAVDLFLSNVPERERSRPPVAAAALYVGALIAGEERSQAAVAEAMSVSRLSVQSRWKGLLADAGFDAPDW
jgi:transcription initiation factor TFIIIB Brf1 subunit/transcription initiation factor TFIIB